MSFQITRRDIETEAGWTAKFYGVSTREALIIEASYILTDKNKEQSKENFNHAMSVMDKLVSKGLIHKNKAARHKSRLNSHIKNI